MTVQGMMVRSEVFIILLEIYIGNIGNIGNTEFVNTSSHAHCKHLQSHNEIQSNFVLP